MSCIITCSELIRSSTYLWGHWWVNKTWSLVSLHFLAKWLLYVKILVNFHENIHKGVNFDIIFHHGCFLGVLKILVQDISEFETSPNKWFSCKIKDSHKDSLLKFQTSKQLLSNPQPLHVATIKSLTVL